MRRKRQELEIATIADFNRVVAEFKAIGREREMLIERRARGQDDAAMLELHKRAVAAESGLEVILLKLLVDTDARFEAYDMVGGAAAKRRQVHAFALFRLLFRTMRETIMDDASVPPGFLDPELWLFNRLAAEIAGIIYERAANPAIPPLLKPWKITTAIAKPDPSAYLKLVSYRTTDLRRAVAAINPALSNFAAARMAARDSARRANVANLFDKTRIVVLDGPSAGRDLSSGISMTIRFAKPGPDDLVGPDDLFARHAGLAYCLLVTDRPPRIEVFRNGASPSTITELDPLPADMPFARPGGARYGIDILRWDPTPEVDAALEHLARVSLNPPGADGPDPLCSEHYPALAARLSRRTAPSRRA